MKSKTKRMAWMIEGLSALAVIIYISAVIGIENHQFKKNAKLVASFKLDQQNAKTLVVYFSRSGNTELMAYKIAEIKQGKLINLVASDYQIGFKGWVNARVDARKTEATIIPEKVDLSSYDTIKDFSPEKLTKTRSSTALIFAIPSRAFRPRLAKRIGR